MHLHKRSKIVKKCHENDCRLQRRPKQGGVQLNKFTFLEWSVGGEDGRMPTLPSQTGQTMLQGAEISATKFKRVKLKTTLKTDFPLRRSRK
jgi:hypothetical protein